MARINPEAERRGPARSFLGRLETYARPERDVSGAQALQQGLAQLSSGLGKMQAKAQQRQNEEDYTKGQADALRIAAGEEPEGIKRKTLFRSQSRFYEMGLAEAQGEQKAIEWSNGLTTAYKKWGGKGSSGNEAFRSWMNQQSSEFLDSLGDNEFALKAAMPYINRANQTMAKHHLAYRDQQMKIARFNAFDTTVSDALDQFEAGNIDGEAMAAAFDRQIKIMKGSGENPTTVVNSIVQAAVHHANAYDNPAVLRELARLHDTGVLKLSKANQAKIADANDAVEDDILRRQRIDAAAAKEATDKANAAAMGAWSDQLADDAFSAMPNPNEVSPELYREMQRMQDAVIQSEKLVSPTESAMITLEIEDIKSDADLSTTEKVHALVTLGQDGAVSDLNNHIKTVLASNDADNIMGSKQFKGLRKNFFTGINAASPDYLNLGGENSALAASMGIDYDNFILAKQAGVDIKDPKAIMDLAREAEQFAVEMALKRNPHAFDKLTNPTLKAQLGITEAQATANAEAAAEAERKAAEDAAAFEATLNGDPEPAPEPAPEPEPEVQPTVQRGRNNARTNQSVQDARVAEADTTVESIDVDAQTIAKARQIMMDRAGNTKGSDLIELFVEAFEGLTREDALDLMLLVNK